MKKPLISVVLLILLSQLAVAVQVDPSLKKKLSSLDMNGTISFIVRFKDTSEISSLNADRKTKLASFRHKARASRANFEKFTENKRRKGTVRDIAFFETLNCAAITADNATVREILGMPEVEKVYLNKRMFLPPEPITVSSMSIRTLSSTVEDNIEQIKAPDVWTGYGYRGTGVVVGVADTGIRSSHPDLTGKIVKEAYFDSSGTKVADVATDIDGHGTHVAGIIAGGNASGKYIGVAPDVTLAIARVFDAPDTSTYAQVAGGVDWLIATGNAQVVNLSLGGTAGSADTFWKDQVKTWTDLGVIVVASIGNSGPNAGTTTSPGNAPDSIGVGAIDNSELVTSFSSRGPVTWDTTTYIKPDVCAPGNAIYSSWYDGSYRASSGTSMAAPHVTGAIALMLEASSSVTPQIAKTILRSTTYNRPGVSYPNNDYGYGRINALAAVNLAINDPTPPVIVHTPVTSSSFGEGIAISATVTDNVTPNPTVTLYYRNSFGEWYTKSMTASSTTYSAVIPGSDVISDVEYYIKAQDIAGNFSTSPGTAPGTNNTVSVAAKSTVSVSEVTATPNPFSPGSGNAVMSFYLSRPAQVTVRVYSITGDVVKAGAFSGIMGYNTFTWDGTTDGSEMAGNGVYIFHVTASDGASIASGKGKLIVLR